jgi:glycosyltransferase involved in cell wall biosynthesis
MTTSPIRIAIDARPFAGPLCGYTIYLGGIIACLRHEDFELTLLTNRPLRAEHRDDTAALQVHVFGRLGDIRWEHTDLPKHLAEAHYDIYFTGANRGIPLRKHRCTRYVLGLLDVIPYLYFHHYHLSRWKTLGSDRALNTELIAQLIAVARADAILTISEQSAVDISRVFHRRNVKALLIRLKDVVPMEEAPCERQFVYVGGSDFRKKIDVLLRGFVQFRRQHPDYRLVLVGWNYGKVGPLISDLGLEDSVTLTGFVDHDTKFRILSQSVALVYPSIYEGYGMAIAEGFQAGIPVIAGGGGSQREVGGTGMRLIDPLSAEDIAAAMSEMLDPDTRAAWVARGREQLARLTDPSIETATIDYFKEQARVARKKCP